MRILPTALALALASPLAAAPAVAAGELSIMSPSPGSAVASGTLHVAASAPGAACVKADLTGTSGGAPRGNVGSVFLATGDGANYSGDIAVPADGGYGLSVSRTDDPECRYGFQYDTTTRFAQITIDRAAPQGFSLEGALIECPGGGRCLPVSGATARISWTGALDPGGRIARYSVRVAGAEIASSTRNYVEFPTAGIPTLAPLSIAAIDEAGNERLAEPAAQILVDRAAPSVSFREPRSPWVRRTTRLRVIARDGVLGSGVVRVGYRASQAPKPGKDPIADLGEVRSLTGGPAAQRVPWNTRKSPDGRREIVAFAVDAAGNIAMRRRVLFVDNTAPKFTTRARKIDLRSGRRTVKVRIRMRDALSPKLRLSYLIRVGNKRTGRVVVRKTWTARDRGSQLIRIPTRKLRVGNYRMTLQVRDLAGNVATRAYTVRVRR